MFVSTYLSWWPCGFALTISWLSVKIRTLIQNTIIPWPHQLVFIPYKLLILLSHSTLKSIHTNYIETQSPKPFTLFSILSHTPKIQNGGSYSFCLQDNNAIQGWERRCYRIMDLWIAFIFIHETSNRRFGSVSNPNHFFIIFIVFQPDFFFSFKDHCFF
jgi:hypothetical protein